MEAPMNKVVRHTILLVTFILVGSLAITAAAQTTATKRPVRIFIFTQVAQPGQPIPSDQKARQDSVADLKTSLINHRTVVVEATSPAQIDLYLEVLRRELRDGPDLKTESYLRGFVGVLVELMAFVSVRISAVGNDSATHIEGGGPGWPEAAEDVLNGVEKWVKQNQAKLPALAVAVQQPVTKRPCRIFVFTKVATPGAPIPPDQNARQHSVTDLTSRLANHRKALVKTKSSEQADLSLEVLGREFRDSAELVTISPKFGGDSLSEAPAASPTRSAFITVRLTAVGHESVSSIVGKGPTWAHAAESVLKAVEKWVNANYDTLLHKGEKK
jgi:hypothetical protein